MMHKGGLSQEIDRIYLEALGRHARMSDLEFQMGLLRQGDMHISEMAATLRDSEEYREKLHMADTIRKGPTPTTHGITLHLDPYDFGLSRMLFLTGDWSPYQTKIMKRLFLSCTSFVDIGAHIGFYSVLCASISPAATITSFEPVPATFDILRKNIDLNRSHNITPVQKAISDRNGTLDLYPSGECNTGDTRPFDEDLVGIGEERRVLHAESARLDDCIEYTDIIKMDIQGGEATALEGMRRILESPKLALVTEFWPRAIEAAGRSPAGFLKDIAGHGFDVYEISKHSGRVEDKSPERILENNIDEDDPEKQTDLLCIKNMELDIGD